MAFPHRDLSDGSAESVSYSWASRSARVIWSWLGSSTKQISVPLPSFQLSLSGVRKSKSSRDSSGSSPT
jgi:hypothetical protein